MTTHDDEAARWRRIADDRLGKLAAIARIGAEPPDAVLAIIKGEEPDPDTGTADTSTMYHRSLDEFRRGLMAAAVHHHGVADEYGTAFDRPRGERVRSELDAHAGSLMAGSYSYVLAAVLKVAEQELGPQSARMLASVADDILANGDDDDLNADVKPGAPLPPPSPAEQADAGQISIWDAGVPA
jgi:hypothetical protein